MEYEHGKYGQIDKWKEQRDCSGESAFIRRQWSWKKREGEGRGERRA